MWSDAQKIEAATLIADMWPGTVAASRLQLYLGTLEPYAPAVVQAAVEGLARELSMRPEPEAIARACRLAEVRASSSAGLLETCRWCSSCWGVSVRVWTTTFEVAAAAGIDTGNLRAADPRGRTYFVRPDLGRELGYACEEIRLWCGRCGTADENPGNGLGWNLPGRSVADFVARSTPCWEPVHPWDCDRIERILQDDPGPLERAKMSGRAALEDMRRRAKEAHPA